MSDAPRWKIWLIPAALVVVVGLALFFRMWEPAPDRELVLEASPSDIARLQRDSLRDAEGGAERTTEGTDVMATSAKVVRARMEAAGARSLAVDVVSANRLRVRYSGLADSGRWKALIGKKASLEFKLVFPDQSLVETGVAPPGAEILPFVERGPEAPTTKIAVYRQRSVSGADLIDAKQSFDPDGVNPVIDIRFNTRGGKKFAKLSIENIGKQFAIILDDVVISTPFIQSPILTGQAQIQGGFSVEEARDLAALLQSGGLPVALKIIDGGKNSPPVKPAISAKDWALSHA
jgi:preprotein translocase subunit SecD